MCMVVYILGAYPFMPSGGHGSIPAEMGAANGGAPYGGGIPLHNSISPNALNNYPRSSMVSFSMLDGHIYIERETDTERDHSCSV